MNSTDIELNDMKKIILDILIYFKKICEANDIKYYLGYGTLLGAVRHKGFIPWDDDVDVIMPREDYNKLLRVLSKETHPYYKLVSIDTEPLFTAPLPKIIDARTELVQNYGFIERVPLGVYIDIFILDGAGDSYEEAVNTFLESWKLYKRWKDADWKAFPEGENKIISFLRWIKRIPLKIKGISYHITKLNDFCKLKDYKLSEYVGVFNVGFKEPERCLWKKESFGEGQKLEFENEFFNAPRKYEDVLTSLYGDYMTLPPENERVTHHKYSVKWKKQFQI